MTMMDNNYDNLLGALEALLAQHRPAPADVSLSLGITPEELDKLHRTSLECGTTPSDLLTMFVRELVQPERAADLGSMILDEWLASHYPCAGQPTTQEEFAVIPQAVSATPFVLFRRVRR